MRAVVQRVSQASVSVDGVGRVGAIGAGLCVLIGVTHDDTDELADRMAAKLAKLRVFADDEGKMNRSVLDIGGSVLVVSQFTLYADAAKGNRPSFVAAAAPDVAEPLIERLVEALRSTGVAVETGRFRTDMAVSLTNDGPVTIIIEV